MENRRRQRLHAHRALPGSRLGTAWIPVATWVERASHRALSADQLQQCGARWLATFYTPCGNALPSPKGAAVAAPSQVCVRIRI